MARAFRLNSTRALGVGAAIFPRRLRPAAVAQDSDNQAAPADQQQPIAPPAGKPAGFRAAMPSIIKATAIVNGDVITQTDVDQRLALLAIANGSGSIPADQVDQLRQQVLRNLIDETLPDPGGEGQTRSRSRKLTSTGRWFVELPPEHETFLPIKCPHFSRRDDSSIGSMRRQIEGEIAWQRLQNDKIEVSGWRR